MKNLAIQIANLLTQCLSSISCSVNKFVDVDMEPMLEVPYPIPELEESFNAEDYINEAVESFVQHNSADPTHIFTHPLIIRQLIIEGHSRGIRDIVPMASGYDNLYFLSPFVRNNIELKPVDFREDHKFILVGNKNAYNDFIMEREILGDHQ